MNYMNTINVTNELIELCGIDGLSQLKLVCFIELGSLIMDVWCLSILLGFNRTSSTGV